MRFPTMKNISLALLIVATQIAARAATPASEGADLQFTADGKLMMPANYRQWPLVGTGLGMAYGPLRQAAGARPPFTNVFVNPASYRAFLQSGAWPDGTLFLLEVRESLPVANATNGANGYFQGGILGIEAEVKDARRFPAKWAFFNLGKEGAGEQIPATASCYSCHAGNAAVENTFVQYYPVLREVASEKGTLRQVPEQF
jgi:hypothetical protein